MYFASADGETLWIWDPDTSLPAGLTPYQPALSAQAGQARSAQPREPVERLILIYTPGEGTAFFDTDDPVESVEAAVFGVAGYTRTETRRRARKFYQMGAPGVILQDSLLKTQTSVYNHLEELLHRETQTDSLDAMQRKIGHVRTVASRVPDLSSGGDMLLLTVSDEMCQIAYGSQPLQPRPVRAAPLHHDVRGPYASRQRQSVSRRALIAARDECSDSWPLRCTNVEKSGSFDSIRGRERSLGWEGK